MSVESRRGFVIRATQIVDHHFDEMLGDLYGEGVCEQVYQLPEAQLSQEWDDGGLGYTCSLTAG